MPTVVKQNFKKTGTKSSTPTLSSTRPKAAPVTLPTVKNVPSDRLSDYSILIYGERKIGKTTLVSMFGDVLFLSTEPGARATTSFIQDVPDWATMVAIVEQLKLVKGKSLYKMHCVDTGGVAYDLALDYACQTYGFDHPGGQNDYGQSWNKVKKEFVIPMRWLLTCGTPLVVLAHEKEKEIETRSGRKFVKMCPNFSKGADEFFTSQIDNVFYYLYEKNQRWLQIEGDEYITAGHRIRNHFLTSSGERVFKVPMGNSEEEAFMNLMTAFNNEQECSYAPETTTTTTTTEKKGDTPQTKAPVTAVRKSFKK